MNEWILMWTESWGPWRQEIGKKKKKKCCKGSFFRLVRAPRSLISQKRKKKSFWTEWQHETQFGYLLPCAKTHIDGLSSGHDHAVVSDDAPDEFHSPCWQSLTTTTCRWCSPTQLALIQTWDAGRNIRRGGMSGFVFYFFAVFFLFVLFFPHSCHD